MSPKRLVRTPELSRYLRMSPRTLEKWRAAGQGPPFLKSGACVLYDLDEVDAWLDARRRPSTASRVGRAPRS